MNLNVILSTLFGISCGNDVGEPSILKYSVSASTYNGRVMIAIHLINNPCDVILTFVNRYIINYVSYTFNVISSISNTYGYSISVTLLIHLPM